MSGCERYKMILEEYIDGLLDESQEREFLEHLGSCPSCSAELEAEMALVERIAALKIEDPGVEFTDAVMDRLFGQEAARRGVFGRILERLGTTLVLHPRLSWSTMISIAVISAFLIPSLVRTGFVDLLGAGTDALSFFLEFLAGTAGFVDRIAEVTEPLAGALYLGMKAIFGFLLAVAGTQQFSFVLIASVLIVMTTSILMLSRAALARRRFSDV